ncbi:MAG TPA: hypothetical protein VMH28_17460 [Candidatus Acidoferrales bacterium]|nr:hypothetical protein [Candidatus Acidoferrales bacterium]
MNLVHRWLCNSANWKNVVGTYILPWTLEGVNLGADLLEVGPGPGVSTDLLRTRVARLTCVEIDRVYADKLRRRAPENVRLPLPGTKALTATLQTPVGARRVQTPSGGTLYQCELPLLCSFASPRGGPVCRRSCSTGWNGG